jgi:hypothetical protein
MAEEQPKILTDHDEIRSWIERHDAEPARLIEKEGQEPELRIKFPGEEAAVVVISWEDFFRQLDKDSEALMIIEGEEEDVPFYRFVSRDVDFESTLRSFDDEAPLIPIGTEPRRRRTS